MDLLINYWTLNGFGASSLFGPIRNRLILGLGDYGSAIESIRITIALPEKSGMLSPAEKTKFGKLPRRQFLRAKKKVIVKCLSQCAIADDDTDDYCIKSINQVLPDVLNAFRMIKDALRPTDEFEYDKFEHDLQQLLTKKFKSIKEIEKNEATLSSAATQDWESEFKERLKNPQLDSKIHNFVINVDKQIVDQYDPGNDLFINQFCCIADWYEAQLQWKLRGAIAQLTINLAEEKARKEHSAAAVINWPFQHKKYHQATDLQKKKMIATAMRDALVWYAKFHKQDTEIVKEAFEEIKKNGFLRTGELKKRISGGPANLVARIEIVHELDGVDLTAAFSKPRSGKILGRKQLGRCPYRPWLLSSLHQFTSWKGSTLVIDIPPIPWSASTNTKGIPKK